LRARSTTLLSYTFCTQYAPVSPVLHFFCTRFQPCSFRFTLYYNHVNNHLLALSLRTPFRYGTDAVALMGGREPSLSSLPRQFQREGSKLIRAPTAIKRVAITRGSDMVPPSLPTFLSLPVSLHFSVFSAALDLLSSSPLLSARTP
jgi:hypothetical protein